MKRFSTIIKYTYDESNPHRLFQQGSISLYYIEVLISILIASLPITIPFIWIIMIRLSLLPVFIISNYIYNIGCCDIYDYHSLIILDKSYIICTFYSILLMIIILLLYMFTSKQYKLYYEIKDSLQSYKYIIYDTNKKK